MLRGISDIRAFFRTNRTPVYFVSPTAFDLLGLDCWLRTFFYVNDFDSFEGGHLPAELRHRLDSKIVTTRLGNQVGSRARRTRSGGPRPTTSRALAGSAGLVVQPRTATPARPRSSSAGSATGTSTRPTWPGQELGS